MKSNASRTARGVALLRAMEMARPEAERITTDPFAPRFVTAASTLGMRLMRTIGVSRLIGVEAMITFALLRERFVEDLMRSQVADGAEQVVVLGAGFDTRAYRMPELAGVSVFEVDHPATQAAKHRALRDVVDPLPTHIHMVAVDFDRDDLGTSLRRVGYDSQKRTLFVWQGVIMYLTAAGVDATLRFIATESRKNSVLVFDYLRNDALAPRSPMRLMTAMMGEQLTFTLDSDRLPAFLAERGLSFVDSIGGEALADRYAAARHRTPPSPGAVIAVARV